MRKASSHPARLSFAFVDPFDPSGRATFRAILRSRARFCGPWSWRLRLVSSFIVTSGTQCRAALNALCWCRGDCACRSRRLPTPWRRKQRSRPERETPGFMNSRTTASRSSSATSSVLRRTTANRRTARERVRIADLASQCHVDHMPTGDNAIHRNEYPHADMRAVSVLQADETLLHKWPVDRTSPFPGQTYPMACVTGMPSAVKPFRTATRTWNSAT